MNNSFVGNFTNQQISNIPANLTTDTAVLYKKNIIRFAEEAIYIYSFSENKMIHADGWDEVLGYENDSINLKDIINATTPKFANFSKDLNDKALKFILTKKERLEEYFFTLEIKKFHKNGEEIPLQGRIGIFKAIDGKIDLIIGRFQVNRLLIFGDVMNFSTFGPLKEEFEAELHNSLLTQLRISQREKEALKLASKGLSFKEISEQLFITASAVEKRILPLYKRFDVKNLPHLISFAYENHILP